MRQVKSAYTVSFLLARSTTDQTCYQERADGRSTTSNGHANISLCEWFSQISGRQKGKGVNGVPRLTDLSIKVSKDSACKLVGSRSKRRAASSLVILLPSG